ncbi:MAG: hypothetical protein ABI950_10155 [Solirubrobacteraceae bacterium]
MAERSDDVEIEHPNRKKASSKVARLIVFVLLIASAVLLLIGSMGGWGETQGARGLQVAFIALYLILAFFLLRWSSGVLPMAAALAIVMAIFALVSAPGWFERDKEGFATTSIGPDVMGLLCIIIAIVQLLLIVASLYAFRQGWGVEVERKADGSSNAEPAIA